MPEIPDPVPNFEFGELPPSVAKALEGLDLEGPTPLDTLGIAQQEVFNSYVRAGFREDQALYLTASFFIGNPGIAPGSLSS